MRRKKIFWGVMGIVLLIGAYYTSAGTLEFNNVPVDITTASNEDLVIVPGSGGNTQIGDATGTNSHASSNDDLHVTGVIEADGVTYSDGGIISSSNILSDTDSTDNLGSSTVSWANLYTDNIKTVSGTNLTILPTSAYTVIGDAGTAGTISANDDLFVSGALEADGKVYADGGITSGSNIISDTDSTDSLGSSSVAWANLYVDTVSTSSGTDLALSPASGSGVDGSVTRSASTGAEVSYDLASTVNKATSGDFTGLKLNVTNTSSPGLLKLLDLQVGSTSVVQVYEAANSSNYGHLSVGADDWDGSTSGYFTGSSNGTLIAGNAGSGFTGNLIDLQIAGSSKFSINSSGNITSAGTSSSSGPLTITSTTTPQLSVRYDSSNKLDVTVSSAGAVTLDATGSSAGVTISDALTASGGITSGSNIVSDTDSTDNLGSSTVAWANLYVDTIATATGQNLAINTAGGTIDIDDGTIDLSTQTVDVTLNAAVDSLNFDSNTLSIDASNDRVGIGESTPLTILEVRNNDATANAIVDVLTVTKDTSGAVANSIGAGVSFQIEDAGGSEEQASIDIQLTDTTDAAEDADFIFSQNTAGTVRETLRLDADVAATTADKLQFTSNTTETDGIVDSVVLKLDTTGTPAANIGMGMSFQVDDAGGVEEQASIDVQLTTVTDASEDADMVFKVNVAGTMTELLRLDGSASSATFAGGITPGGNLTLADDQWVGLGSAAARIIFDATSTPDDVEIMNGNVGIGTQTPTYELDVVGNIGLDQYLYHNDDTDTYLNFTVDDLDIVVGNETFVNIAEDDVQDIIELGDDGDIDIKLSGGSDGTLFVEGSSAKVGIGESTPLTILEVRNNDATANAIVDVLTVTKDTSGAVANSIGAGVSFQIEDAGGSEEQASIDVQLTDTTDAAEDADFIFSQNTAGTVRETLRIDADVAATTADKLQFTSNTTETDGIVDSVVLKLDTTGTPAANIGMGMSFQVDDAGGVEEQASIDVQLTTVTDLSEDSDMIFSVQKAGTITEILRIDGSTGNVGIGTTSATGRLDVRGDEVRIWDGTATVDYALSEGELYVEGDLEVDATSYLSATTIGTSGMSISGAITSTAAGANSFDGNITTAGDLDVNGGDIKSTGALTVTPGAATNFNLVLTTTGDFVVNTNQLVVDTSAGYVGIGDTVPQRKLHVEVASASCLWAERTTDDGAIIELVQDGTSEGNISVAGTTVSYNAFLGSHYTQLKDNQEILPVGTIVVSTGEIIPLRNPQQSTNENDIEKFPFVKKSSQRAQKGVYGVWFAKLADDAKDNSFGEPDKPIYQIAALGLYQIRVTDSAGNIQNGDFIQASPLPGEGEKQVDEQGNYQPYLMDKTVGKALVDVNWNEVKVDPKLGYKWKLIPATLHSG